MNASSEHWLDGYLALLGIERQPPSLDYLRRLTRAHVLRVPFANVTSILRRASAGDAPVPPLERSAALGAWTDRRGGGVCFEVTDMFGTLLSALGFPAHPVLATISFPGSHQGVVVNVDGQRYLVDAGNGAPFFEPIPVFDPHPLVISQAGLSYRFHPKPDTADCWVQDRLIDGAWQPFCTYDLAAATDAARQSAYERHHLRGHSWVVDELRVVRCTDAEVWTLRAGALTHFAADGSKSVRELSSAADVRAIVADVFDLPNAPIEAALNAIRQAGVEFLA